MVSFIRSATVNLSAQLKLRPTTVQFALVALVAATLMLSAATLRAQEPAAHGEAGAAHGEAAHEESIWPQVGKIVNFAMLVGTVVYFARKPIADYLASPHARRCARTSWRPRR